MKLYDTAARIAMIRTPMSCSNMVRSSLTFMTTLKGIQVVTCIVSVNRSMRTAKIAAIRHLSRHLHQQQKQPSKHCNDKKKLRNKSDVQSPNHFTGDTHDAFIQRFSIVRDL